MKRPRRAAVLWAIALLVAVACGLLVLRARAPSGPQVDATPALGPDPAASVAALPAGPRAPASSAARVAAPVAAPARASSPSPAAWAPARAERQHWDLCDVGRLPIAPGTPSDEPPRHVFDALAAGLAAQWPSALNGAPERTRAAALRLGLRGDAAGRPEPVPLALAEASADPVISAWALQGCGSDANCRAAAAARWQALEPDNLAPRLLALPHDARPDAAALQALATARRFDAHFGQLAPALLLAWPPGQPRALQVDLIVRAIGIELAAAVPPMQPLASACREHASEAGVRPACQRLARTLMHHSDTLLAVGIGVGLGRVAGLPARELDAVRAQLQQAPEVTFAMDERLAEQPWACASHALTRAWIGEVQQHGEWGALQRRRAAAQAPPR